MSNLDSKVIELESKIADLEARFSGLQINLSIAEELSRGFDDVAVRPLEDRSGSAFTYGVVGGVCKFLNCRFMFGRKTYSINDQTANSNGTYYLIVPHSNPEDATVSVGGVNTSSSDTHTVVPLIAVENGIITADYRGMPCIPVYE
jgi:hypothetical protein